ncbi:hypothetical protein BDC45DRAFT_535200 [Circinella umbellata]|nr:hypothetical protein BDC45DRAFT_535200 [Circinella umbellata]
MYIKIISSASSKFPTTVTSSSHPQEQPVSCEPLQQCLDQQQSTVVQLPSSLSDTDFHNEKFAQDTSINPVLGNESTKSITMTTITPIYLGNKNEELNTCHPSYEPTSKYYYHTNENKTKDPVSSVSLTSTRRPYKEQAKDNHKVYMYNVNFTSNNEKEFNRDNFACKEALNYSKRKHDNEIGIEEQKQNDQSQKLKTMENKSNVKRICIPKDQQQLNRPINTVAEKWVERLSDCIKDYRTEINEEKKKLKSLKRTLARLEKTHSESIIDQYQEEDVYRDDEEEHDSDDEEEKYLTQARTAELYRQLIKYAQEQLAVIQSI